MRTLQLGPKFGFLLERCSLCVLKSPMAPLSLSYRLVHWFLLKITLFCRSLPLHKIIHWTQRTSICHFACYPTVNILCNHRQWLKQDFCIETILLTKLHTFPHVTSFPLPGCFCPSFPFAPSVLFWSRMQFRILCCRHSLPLLSLLSSLAVLHLYFVFHDIVILEEDWPVILQNIPLFGFFLWFLIIRLRLCFSLSWQECRGCEVLPVSVYPVKGFIMSVGHTLVLGW